MERNTQRHIETLTESLIAQTLAFVSLVALLEETQALATGTARQTLEVLTASLDAPLERLTYLQLIAEQLRPPPGPADRPL